MHKDPDLGHSVEYAKHSRNSALGKAGVNRTKRHRVKQAVSQGPCDPVAAPAKPKHKKRFGIKRDKFCDWYATEKARKEALRALEKQLAQYRQTLKESKVFGIWAQRQLSQVTELVER